MNESDYPVKSCFCKEKGATKIVHSGGGGGGGGDEVLQDWSDHLRKALTSQLLVRPNFEHIRL